MFVCAGSAALKEQANDRGAKEQGLCSVDWVPSSGLQAMVLEVVTQEAFQGVLLKGAGYLVSD